MRVDVHIERLVLHGIAEPDAADVAEALREGLADLIAADPPQWTAVGRPLAVRYVPDRSPQGTGTAIADSVHNGLHGRRGS